MAATCGQSPGRRSRTTVVTATVFPLSVVVQRELHRMRPQANRVDLVLALPADPGLDQVLAEHAALQEELVIGFERVDRLRERARNRLDVVLLLEQVEVRGL